jgi:hypothetical protein
MVGESNEQEALALCDKCGLEEATHDHTVDDGGDRIAVCEHCCQKNCDYVTQCYYESCQHKELGI